MPQTLVTGGAGFIGSHLVRALLERGDAVRVLDDFSTGYRANLDAVRDDIELIEGSICDLNLTTKAMQGVDFCFHQAAIPSVPRSISDPWYSNRVNVEGSLNVFLAARDAGVRRVMYASSSSVYGNAATMPLVESFPREPISPYGVTKATMEMYAHTFSDLYDIDIVGLRYFNVFGPRQDILSDYAAVVPIFLNHMTKGERPPVFGNGLQSRDFSYVQNIVHANLLAADAETAIAGVYNIACGAPVTVCDLVAMLNDILGTALEPDFRPERSGDILNSHANISKARDAFGFAPVVTVQDGLVPTVEWFRDLG